MMASKPSSAVDARTCTPLVLRAVTSNGLRPRCRIAVKWRVAALLTLAITARSHCRVSIAKLTALASAGRSHGCTEDSHGEVDEVPQIIHQSWKNTDVPERFHKWTATWQETHPSWHYQLWTDADNRNLVATKYQWFLDTYDALPAEIARADTARLLYMHAFGGMYADLDFEALKKVEELLVGHKVYLAAMGTDEDFEHGLPNAWMASVPGHPFWLFCLQLVTKLNYSRRENETIFIEAISGPSMIHKAVRDYRSTMRGKSTDLKVLPAGVIYPLDWRNSKGEDDAPNAAKMGFAAKYCAGYAGSFDAERCKSHFPDAYAITYWTHSWQI